MYRRLYVLYYVHLALLCLSPSPLQDVLTDMSYSMQFVEIDGIINETYIHKVLSDDIYTDAERMDFGFIISMHLLLTHSLSHSLSFSLSSNL